MSEIVRSKRKCSVIGCHNSEAKNPDLNFYRFPGKSYETERNKRWIAAVRSENPDGTPWIPNAEARVCSVHFVGGKKSENIHDEAYVPTIFSWNYKQKLANQKRAEHLREMNDNESINQQINKENQSDNVEHNEGHTVVEEETVAEENKAETACISTQTDPIDEVETSNVTYLFCAREKTEIHFPDVVSIKNEVSIQTKICIFQPQPRTKIIIPEKYLKTTRDTGCGPDIPSRLDFMGFVDVETDTIMRQLAGVTRAFFFVLLGLIDDRREDGKRKYYRTLGKEDRLLLFLIKLKLGITYCALGCLFHVSATTASRIFFSLLDILTNKTKSWIFWPSKESVKINLPKSFYKYPNCRCIIDCTEIPMDTPPTVDQRILTYSNYKGKFTLKFLIVITPDGFICKVSKAYGGRATDAFITNDSGFLGVLEPGDEVLADKGFPQIRSELVKRNVILTIPPFAFNPQFTAEEVEEGYNIASVRIHVERSIQRIKLLHILDHITIDLVPYVDAIMHMCCIVANSKPPLIREQ